MKIIEPIALACAVALGVAALAVSLMHGGPRGPQGPAGPQGQTGHNAQVAHLGVCWNPVGNIDASGNANPILMLTAPDNTSGVPSCPSGQFVSVVPGG